MEFEIKNEVGSEISDIVLVDSIDKFISGFEKNLNKIEQGDLFVIELDLDGCFVHGRIRGKHIYQRKLMDIYENPPNESLFETLKLMKEIIKNRGAIFQVNLCSTANFAGADRSVFDKIFELNDNFPIMQTVNVNGVSKVRLFSEEQVGYFVRPDILRDVDYATDGGTILKDSALEFTIKLRYLAEKYKLEKEDERDIRQIQIDIIKKDIELPIDYRNNLYFDNPDLERAAEKTCFIDNDISVSNRLACRDFFDKIQFFSPESSAVRFINPYDDCRIEVVPVEEIHEFYKRNINGSYYDDVNQIYFSEDANSNRSNYVYLKDLNKELERIRDNQKDSKISADVEEEKVEENDLVIIGQEEAEVRNLEAVGTRISEATLLHTLLETVGHRR